MLKLPQVILNTVPEGPLTRDARDVRELLLDKERTAVVMVTLAEEMPANEAVELQTKLRDEIGLEVQMLVINQTYPRSFVDGSDENQILNTLGRADASLDAKAVAEHCSLMKARSQLHEKYSAILRKSFRAPIAEIGKRFAEQLGSAEIGDIAVELGSQFR